MKLTARIGLGSLLIALVTGCAAEEPARTAETAPAAEQPAAAATTRAEIEDQLQNWMQAEQADDGAQAGADFANDAVMVNARYGRVEGQQAITQAWTEAFAAQPGSAGTQLQTLKWGTSGNLAYVVGRYTSGVTMAGTDGQFITVSERQPDGSLKIVAQMSIPDPQPQR